MGRISAIGICGIMVLLSLFSAVSAQTTPAASADVAPPPAQVRQMMELMQTPEVKQWMATQQQRLLQSDLGREVKEMYNDVFGFSERWSREFREFWKLPDDFVFDL